MKLERFLLMMQLAGRDQFGQVIPPRPSEVSLVRWMGMLRYWGTHHAV